MSINREEENSNRPLTEAELRALTEGGGEVQEQKPRRNFKGGMVAPDPRIKSYLYYGGVSAPTEDVLALLAERGITPKEREPLIVEEQGLADYSRYAPAVEEVVVSNKPGRRLDSSIFIDNSSDAQVQEIPDKENIGQRIFIREEESKTFSGGDNDTSVEGEPGVIEHNGLYSLSRSGGQGDYVYRTEESSKKMRSLIDYWNKLPAKTGDEEISFDKQSKEEESTRFKTEKSTVIALADYIDAENLFLGWCTHCSDFIEKYDLYGGMTGSEANYRTEEECPVCRNNTLYGATISVQLDLISVPGLLELEIEEDRFDVFGLEDSDYQDLNSFESEDSEY